jgi:hypothetical protein
LDDSTQIRFIGNTFNGNGQSGGIGQPNIVMEGETSNVNILGNYWEGGANGRQKLIFNDTSNYLNMSETALTEAEILDNTGVARYSTLAPDRTAFGGRQWTDQNLLSIGNESAVQKTTNYNITNSDSGTTLWTSVDGVVFGLPPTVLGMVVRIQNRSVDGGSIGEAEITISPNAADKIIGAQNAGTDDRDIVNTKATHKRGDMIELIGDGNDGWFIRNIYGTWDREAP